MSLSPLRFFAGIPPHGSEAIMRRSGRVEFGKIFWSAVGFKDTWFFRASRCAKISLLPWAVYYDCTQFQKVLWFVNITFAAFSKGNGSVIGVYWGLRLFLFFFVESDIMNSNKQTKISIKMCILGFLWHIMVSWEFQAELTTLKMPWNRFGKLRSWNFPTLRYFQLTGCHDPYWNLYL